MSDTIKTTRLDGTMLVVETKDGTAASNFERDSFFSMGLSRYF